MIPENHPVQSPTVPVNADKFDVSSARTFRFRVLVEASDLLLKVGDRVTAEEPDGTPPNGELVVVEVDGVPRLGSWPCEGVLCGVVVEVARDLR